MKYSIIVPCYNTAHTLEKTAYSIQKCGLPQMEILLVDDGSSDETSALCDRLAENEKDVRCIHKENGGVSSARNRGLQEAQGEYVWFFDSDDRVDTDSMKRAARIIDELSPDMLMFGMSFDSYSGKRLYRRLELYYEKEMLMSPSDIETSLTDLYHNNMITPCWNKIIRRRILMEHEILFRQDMIVMEDFLFSLETIRKCETVYSLPQVIYRYDQGDGLGAERAAARLKNIEDLPEYLRPFGDLLSGHPDIMNTLFFSLLRQKLRVQTTEEMRETAKTVCDSSLALSEHTTDADKQLIRELKDGRFKDIRKALRKGQRRSSVINAIKRSYVYSVFKGVTIKRAEW